MRVFVLYSVTRQPYGGANQFIRALKDYLEKEGVLTRNILTADIIFFNSHLIGGLWGRLAPFAYLLKLLFPRKIFVHRVDGPIQAYGGKERVEVDREIYALNRLLADGTVYQTGWSRDENITLGMDSTKYEVTICNAADPAFFFPLKERSPQERIRLIASAWSNHSNKGFDMYRELDKRLDWTRFEMTFVGRSGALFDHIKVHGPVSSDMLGELLRSHDIFITASRNDPCSNSVLEALACGLPVVARNSGGHPELVGEGGELFETVDEAVAAIERMARDLDEYGRRINVADMETVGSRYVQFFKRIFRDVEKGHYTPKRISVRETLGIIFDS